MNTLTESRTASIIVALEKDAFIIKQMLFTGGELMETINWPGLDVAENATARFLEAMRMFSGRRTSVFITVSAAKRMTDEQIAAIQTAALETRT